MAVAPLLARTAALSRALFTALHCSALLCSAGVSAPSYIPFKSCSKQWSASQFSAATLWRAFVFLLYFASEFGWSIFRPSKQPHQSPRINVLSYSCSFVFVLLLYSECNRVVVLLAKHVLLNRSLSLCLSLRRVAICKESFSNCIRSLRITIHKVGLLLSSGFVCFVVYS